VYSVFASAHLGCEVRKPDRRVDSPEACEKLTTYRQIGKQAILGLGYGMGAGTFIDRLRQKPEVRPLFDRAVLDNRTCAGIVYGYREQYPAIPKFWADCERAVRAAVGGGVETVRGIRFDRDAAALRIHLPSGRALVYPNPRIESATYQTRRYIDRSGRWAKMEDTSPRIVYDNRVKTLGLYGGKIVENIVQAYARDLLVRAMCAVERAGFRVYVHCHDSITVMAPAALAEKAEAALLKAWREPPEWATGLVLDAESKTGVNLAQV
jgi:DNA polymerase